MKKSIKKPVKTEAAATVILTRVRNEKVQVYLLKRSPKSGFMAGNYVFPGGRLDPEDLDTAAWGPRVDMELSMISQRLGGGISGEDILGYGVAAIRETLEEAGIFLGLGEGGLQSDVDRVCEYRTSGGLKPGWLLKLALDGGCSLAFSSLSRWSHWITPLIMKRRYDTRFFLAHMPQGQTCAPDERETIHGLWVTPEEALAGNHRGEIPLSPPTLVTLHEMLSYADPEKLQKESEKRGWGEPIMPRLVPVEKGSGVILEPWDPQYNDEEIKIDQSKLPDKVLPPNAPFSRIWNNRGLCRAVEI